MPKMFDLLAQEKGIFPYDYYTLKLYIENIGNIDDAMQFLTCTRDEFKSAI